MSCYNCGAELPESAKFCPECAAPVRSKSRSDAESATEADGLRTGKNSTFEDPGGEDKSERIGYSRKAGGLIIALVVLSVIGIVGNNLAPGGEDPGDPSPSASSTPAKTIAWPSSLEEITGASAEDLELSDVCTFVAEKIIGLPVFESPGSKLKELKELDGPYESVDFVAEHSWVAVASAQNPNGLLEDAVDEQLESFLLTSDSPDWEKMSLSNRALFGRLSGELRRAVLSNCGLTEEFANVAGLALAAQTTVKQAANAPWYPDDFNLYYGDTNVAWKWVKGRSCTYSSASCWHMDLMTRAGADYVYVEISIEDSSGSYVDYSNDTARNLRPGQVAKLEFSSFSRGPLSGQIAEINVR